MAPHDGRQSTAQQTGLGSPSAAAFRPLSRDLNAQIDATRGTVHAVAELRLRMRVREPVWTLSLHHNLKSGIRSLTDVGQNDIRKMSLRLGERNYTHPHFSRIVGSASVSMKRHTRSTSWAASGSTS